MTTCREFFTFSWPLRGRGGRPKRSAWPLFSRFFFSPSLKWIQNQYSWKDDSSYKLYTLGPLCLWQCLIFKGDIKHIKSSWNPCVSSYVHTYKKCLHLKYLAGRTNSPLEFSSPKGGKDPSSNKNQFVGAEGTWTNVLSSGVDTKQSKQM